MAEQQRRDQQRESGAQERNPGTVEPRAWPCRLAWHQPERGKQEDGADRSIDKEYGAPAETGEIKRDQPTAEHEADRAAKPERNPENREGAAARRIRKQIVNGGEHLR